MWQIILVLLIIIIGAILLPLVISGQKLNKTQTFPFKKKTYFFNTSEQKFFELLETGIDKNRYSVFPKVRLGDYIETTNGGNERWGSWNRIKSRHVDFLIWDKSISQIVLAIELDGGSHNRYAAKDGDSFKDKLFKTIGIELVRVRVGTNFEQEIATIQQKLIN